jgi:hypothetical protein
MAREGGGGGGAFGWTLLGILVGVAGTLAVETLLSHQQPRQVEEQQPASSASVAVATAAPVAPKPVEKPVLSAAPVKSSAAAEASQEDVEDDAAAAGMTSRSHPDQSQPGPAGAPN